MPRAGLKRRCSHHHAAEKYRLLGTDDRMFGDGFMRRHRSHGRQGAGRKRKRKQGRYRRVMREAVLVARDMPRMVPTCRTTMLALHQYVRKCIDR